VIRQTAVRPHGGHRSLPTFACQRSVLEHRRTRTGMWSARPVMARPGKDGRERRRGVPTGCRRIRFTELNPQRIDDPQRSGWTLSTRVADSEPIASTTIAMHLKRGRIDARKYGQ